MNFEKQPLEARLQLYVDELLPLIKNLDLTKFEGNEFETVLNCLYTDRKDFLVDDLGIDEDEVPVGFEFLAHDDQYEAMCAVEA